MLARPPAPFEGKRPYLATADVQDCVATPAEDVAFDHLPSRAGLQLAEGDVLQAKMFATDKAFRVSSAEAGWLASTGFAQFTPERVGNNPDFLFHWLRNPEFHRIKDRLSVGSTQQAISQTDLASIPLSMPRPAEQARIAYVLDTMERCYRLTQSTAFKLRQVRAGLLNELATLGVDENGVVRDPVGHPELFTVAGSALLPNGWQVRPLERIADPRAPIGYGIVQVREYVPGGVPVLAIRDMLGDFVTGVHLTDPAIEAQYVRSRVQTGDVLISVKGTIGRIAIVPTHYYGNISRDLARVRPGAGIVPEFLLHLLRSHRGQKALELTQVGTTRAELSIAPLRRVEFAIPPEDEQVRIAGMLHEMDDSISLYEASTAKLRRLQLGFMKDVLTGSLRVPEDIFSA